MAFFGFGSSVNVEQLASVAGVVGVTTHSNLDERQDLFAHVSLERWVEIVVAAAFAVAMGSRFSRKHGVREAMIQQASDYRLPNGKHVDLSRSMIAHSDYLQEIVTMYKSHRSETKLDDTKFAIFVGMSVLDQVLRDSQHNAPNTLTEQEMMAIAGSTGAAILEVLNEYR
jgi:hypothetical protein